MATSAWNNHDAHTLTQTLWAMGVLMVAYTFPYFLTTTTVRNKHDALAYMFDCSTCPKSLRPFSVVSQYLHQETFSHGIVPKTIQVKSD